MRLTSRIQPRVRQRDVQVALVVSTLLRRPFVTAEQLAVVLQRTPTEAAEALETAYRCVTDGEPLITPHKDAGCSLSTPVVLSLMPDPIVPSCDDSESSGTWAPSRLTRPRSQIVGSRSTTGSLPGTTPH